MHLPADSLAEGARLSVARRQNEATLSWALSTDMFLLESAPRSDASQWEGVVETLQIVDGQCAVTVSLDGGQRYFRLRKQVPLPMPAPREGPPTIGYITAVLRSECASSPPPPPVGQVVVGSNYVIKTVADADAMDYQGAQQLVTDAAFESLMPLYCGLANVGCATNRVQWNLITYDAGGNPRISGSPVSGPGYHYCAVTNGVSRGYITAVLRSECTSAPVPPPVGQTRVGTDYVIRTIAEGDPMDYSAAQQIVTDTIFQSLMPLYCGLPKVGCVTNRVQWNLMTYDAGGNPRISGGPLSGFGYHYCP